METLKYKKILEAFHRRYTAWLENIPHFSLYFLKIIPENVIPGISLLTSLCNDQEVRGFKLSIFYFRIHFLCQSFSVVVRICFTLSIPRIKSAAFSAIMIVGAFVFPDGILRMTEASATRRFFTPLTLVKNDKIYI